MKRYAIEIKKHREFCELCNEHHDHFDCPACGKDFYGIVHKDRIATCQHCRTNFICWGKDKAVRIILVECSEISFTQVFQIWCSHDTMDYCECSEDICPLLEKETSILA